MQDALADLQRRIEATLPVKVLRLEPLIGGACQDNICVDLEPRDGPAPPDPLRLVLRSDPDNALPGSLGRLDEYSVIEAAVAAGVRTPAVRWLTADLVRDGAHAYFMDWAPGVAIGRKVVEAPELAEARAGLPAALAQQLAAIHSVTPERAPALRFPNFDDPRGAGPAASMNAFIRRMLDALPEPHPAAELALRWLESNAPSDEPVTLVHADFRTGNFLVTPAGLSAVLDWEFAHWGSPYEDLAWISVRDWRFGRLDHPVGGFAQREPFYAAYEAASGRTVDPERVHYWEVSGNLRWALGCAFQGQRYLSGQRRDLELIAIARRACEMEFEALRLIERGPRHAR